ncbi:MAG: hypothetical protein Q7V16_00360 [Hydrogenophaga sp.]|jgi:hypothetical protein|nr:hypothetical protein [Hydrogenophaga sp.]
MYLAAGSLYEFIAPHPGGMGLSDGLDDVYCQLYAGVIVIS